jgi:hypothetical protein
MVGLGRETVGWTTSCRREEEEIGRSSYAAAARGETFPHLPSGVHALLSRIAPSRPRYDCLAAEVVVVTPRRR